MDLWWVEGWGGGVDGGGVDGWEWVMPGGNLYWEGEGEREGERGEGGGWAR